MVQPVRPLPLAYTLCECGHTRDAHRADTWYRLLARLLIFRRTACYLCLCNVFTEETRFKSTLTN